MYETERGDGRVKEARAVLRGKSATFLPSDMLGVGQRVTCATTGKRGGAVRTGNEGKGNGQFLGYVSLIIKKTNNVIVHLGLDLTALNFLISHLTDVFLGFESPVKV